MKQYCVLMTCGAYEDSSLSSLTLFFLVEEDLSPKKVAKLWKEQMEICCKASERNIEPKDLFLEFFNTSSHEIDYEAEEEFMFNWSYIPIKVDGKIPKIDKVIFLQGMDWYLEGEDYHYDNIFEEFIIS